MGRQPLRGCDRVVAMAVDAVGMLPILLTGAMAVDLRDELGQMEGSKGA